MTRPNNKKSKTKVGGSTWARLKHKFAQKNPRNNQHYNVNTVELGKTSDTISIHLKKILKLIPWTPPPPAAGGAEGS